MDIPIDKIICDIRGRTNQDVTELYRILSTFGQRDPLLVEGPDQKGNYYLIHGYLRFLAMLKDKSKFHTVKCTVNSDLTSQEKRNALRLILISSGKKTTGLDQQLVYEEIQDLEYRSELIPKGKKKRMEKGKEVPQEVRIDYEMNRRSQDALSLIYGLNDLGKYKNQLLKELHDGNITTIHADAIKRIVRHPMYNILTLNQKIAVIEKARKSAKFTDNQAGFIILEQVMKQYPQKENINNWIEYICDEIEKISELIHDQLGVMTTEFHERKLINSMKQLQEKLDLITKRRNSEKQMQLCNPIEKIVKDNNKDKISNKRIIIMEKRNGNKLTFYFS